MALTDVGIRTLVPAEKTYRKHDSRGLYLEVSPAGGKLWRFRYQFVGKSQQLALGTYPEVTLSRAREERDKAITKLAEGINPALEKKQRKQSQIKSQAGVENTFKKVAFEWWQKQKPGWSEDPAQLVWRRLELNVIPWIGARPIAEIEPPDLLQQLRRIEERGAVETARRILQIIGQIFRYSVASGYCKRNQAADLRGSLAKPKGRQWPAILDKEGIRNMLIAIDGYQGSFVTRAALRILTLTFQRPGEVRNMRWGEIDFEDMVWEIPAERMKMKRPHIVPLSRQAIEVLHDLYPLTGPDEHAFPGEGKAKSLSENTLNQALRRMGISREKMVSHGWRVIASTYLHESGLFDSRVVETQLAHLDRNSVRQAYNRALYVSQRKEMMQIWADFLDDLKADQKAALSRQRASS